MEIGNLLGIALIVLAAGLIFVFALPRRKPLARALRPIPAVKRLRRAIGLAVEDGKRLHVSLGSASITSPQNASALVGLSALERIAQISVISDRPPVATSGDGSLALLTQDTLQGVYRAGNAMDQFDPDRGRLTGTDPLSYVSGAIPVMHREQVSANVLIGNFGPEVGLLCEASEHANAFSLAASDSLPAQAVMFATAEETLIGEEMFALPAYLQAGAAHQASLRAQDYLRLVLVGALILGAILKFLGFM
jgi:hypothetical protein